MTRWLVLLAAGCALLTVADAGAQPRGQKPVEKKVAEKKEPAASDRPLHLYLAKGELNACGEGCSMWIAVEGRFDPGSSGRAVAFLRRHAARKLPVYFHSPGGNGPDAIAIGRTLRQLGITVGVGATVPQGCASVRDTAPACAAAKRSPQPVAAEWRPDATCSSACVWAMIGGKVRHVPPSARLGIHSGKLLLTRRWSDGRVQQVSPKEAAHKARAAESVATARRYIREMVIDTALMDEALKIPHEDIRYLSRAEIAAFGIDRREFAETPWFFTQLPSGTRYVSKWIVEAKGSQRKHYRISVASLTCTNPLQVSVHYLRGVASDEVAPPSGATLSLGERKSTFYFRGKPTKRDTVDNGAMFVLGTTYVPFEYIEAVAVDGPISVSDGNYTHEEWTHDVKFSIRGLAEGIKILREKCTSPPVDATTPPPELPKNVWNPKGLHLPSDWKPTPRKQ
jgi:hypothetical protein